MSRLILIQTGQTDWRAQQRLAGDTDLPLNELGQRQALAAAQALRVDAPARVVAGPDEAAKQTGRIIAGELNLKPRTAKGLREVHFGLWAGLLEDEVKERFAKAYRQWRSDPLSVEPPEGESIPTAAARLKKAASRIRQANPDETIALVVGPFAWAILRCEWVDANYERFWEHVEGEETSFRIEEPPSASSTLNEA